MSIIVKAYMTGKDKQVKEIRRFSVDKSVFCSFQELRSKTAEFFSSLEDSSFDMLYKDEEEDMVTFSSDNELMVASGSIKDATFRLHIQEKHAEKKGPAPAQSTASPPLVDAPIHGDPSSQHSQPPHFGSSVPSHIGGVPVKLPPQGIPKGRPFVLIPELKCDGCEAKVTGKYFKCSVCPDFDLCETCMNRGDHAEHSFIAYELPSIPETAIEKPTVLSHIGVVPVKLPPQGIPKGRPFVLIPELKCDGCEAKVTGKYFKCSVCPDFDLCEACMNRGDHAEHGFIAYELPSIPETPIEKPPVPSHIDGVPVKLPPQGISKGRPFVLIPELKCDGCEAKVTGKYFKCSVCPDFDLCEACMNRGDHAEHGFIAYELPSIPETAIEKLTVLSHIDGVPVKLPPQGISKGRPFVLIPELKCDGCEAKVTGKYFKCSVCPDFDLCETCMNRGDHAEHGFIAYEHAYP